MSAPEASSSSSRRSPAPAGPSSPPPSSTQQQWILVTGGAGYVGSHTIVQLIKAGYNVVIVDSLVNAYKTVIDRLNRLTRTRIPFEHVDLCNADALESVFERYPQFEAVLHFAALKAVGESVRDPLRYYQNNLIATLNLLQCMRRFHCGKIVFSSSATVYGSPELQRAALLESDPTDPQSPYGKSKLFVENILSDCASGSTGDSSWLQVVLLRYFNPCGADVSGEIGEEAVGVPANLMPLLCRVANGQMPSLAVFGDDYDTVDGTGVRDYVHVVDIARGHVCALKALHRVDPSCNIRVYNLGSGQGTSVLQLIEMMSKVCGRKLSYEIVGRRDGDVATLVADPSKAERELNWSTQLSIEDACVHAWAWTQRRSDATAAAAAAAK